MILKYLTFAHYSLYGNLKVKATDIDPSYSKGSNDLVFLIIIIAGCSIAGFVVILSASVGIYLCIKKKKNSMGVPNEISPNSFASSQETFVNNNNQQNFPEYPKSE